MSSATVVPGKANFVMKAFPNCSSVRQAFANTPKSRPKC